MSGRTQVLLAVALGALALVAPPGTARAGDGVIPRDSLSLRLPRLVFVARARVGPAKDVDLDADASQWGPGRLMVREPDGRIRPLIREGAPDAVGGPDVSWDGRRIVFAGIASGDSLWRIWVVNADGSGLRQVTHHDPALDRDPIWGSQILSHAFALDFEPCWLPDGRICFASTRQLRAAPSGRGWRLAPDLFTVGPDGSNLQRLTNEPAGARHPTVDPRTGRIVFSRWLRNPWMPSELATAGVTLDPAQAVPAEPMDLWQTVSILPDGSGMRLAGGDPRSHEGMALYRPAVAGGGAVFGLDGLATPSVPGRSPHVMRVHPAGVGAAGGPPSWGTPGREGPVRDVAAIPGGWIVYSMRSGRTGDDLWVAREDGFGRRPLVERADWDDSEAAPLVRRKLPPIASAPRLTPAPMPAASAADLGAGGATFRFDCLNVFATGPVDGSFPDALPMQRDVRIRFFALLRRPVGLGGDTLALLREAEVTPGGAVHEHDMPADVPMFEQLVDAEGRILRSSRAPAHVPGFNATPWGSGTHCVGCHAGHSALPVAASYKSGKYTNASPSARVTASGSAPGSSPAAVADRRTRGPAGEVAWIGAMPGDSLSLEWRWPVEVREVVLYAIRRDRATRTDLTLGGCELTLLRQGREVGRRTVRGPLSPKGTRVAIDDVAVDALRVRPLAPKGRVAGVTTTGLAEVETLARLVEE